MRAKSVASVILGIVSVIGVAATAYMAAKETPKAKETLDNAKKKYSEEHKKDIDPETVQDEHHETIIEMPTSEQIKIIIPCYKKTIMVAGGTILTIVGGHIVHVVITSSAMAGAYVWQKKYLNLDKIVKDKAKEMGLDSFYKDAKVDLAKEEYKHHKETAKEKKAEAVAKALNTKVVKVYDTASSQIIWTTENKIFYAQYLVNQNLARKGYCTQNAFLIALGGHMVDDGDRKGWSLCNSRQARELLTNPDDDSTTYGPVVDCIIDRGTFPDAGSEEVLYIHYNCCPDFFDDAVAYEAG